MAAVLPLLVLAACARSVPPTAQAASPPDRSETPRAKREIRLTGLVEAVHSSKVIVPQIFGPGGPMTLTHLIRNGADVKQGDIIATFDATTQIDAARDAQAKYDDLGHQVEQKAAQNRADAEKRALDLRQAEADFAKAELELKKGPTLAEIKLEQAKAKVEVSRKHVDSLRKSNEMHDRADAAALRILELQRDRQKVALDRAQSNINRLEIHSALPGMVAIQDVWRSNSRGKPQEGDQLFPRQPLASIFDPKEMAVRCAVGEPDGSVLERGSRATVYLDAYPDIALPAHVEFVSPVAASAIGSPIKSFTALIKLERTDPRVMPDLSAAVVVAGAAGSSVEDGAGTKNPPQPVKRAAAGAVGGTK
jgi:multidrug efflux pump subunit AcrA (membrane-fusion protein)